MKPSMWRSKESELLAKLLYVKDGQHWYAIPQWSSPQPCRSDIFLATMEPVENVPVSEKRAPDSHDGICGFCDLPGADKIPHPVRWPGEQSAGTEYVHAECEDAECQRAHSLLTDKQRAAFLRNL